MIRLMRPFPVKLTNAPDPWGLSNSLLQNHGGTIGEIHTIQIQNDGDLQPGHQMTLVKLARELSKGRGKRTTGGTSASVKTTTHTKP